MSMRTILLVLVAVVTAAVTALYARNWIQTERAALLASMPEEKPMASAQYILVTKKGLSAGSFVKANHLKWQAWPEDGVIDSYAVKGERRIEEFVGAVARETLTAGEPLTNARVVHPGDRGFLAAVLEPGKRAVSVPVNATSGISGFVFPGDWVDLILTGQYGVSNGEGKKQSRRFSETLLSDIRVLAIDQTVGNAEGTVRVAKTATLEVTPKQVETIAIALDMGSISLSLHSLAREQDEFSQMARAMGADPVETLTKRTYTMDTELYYMRNDLSKKTKTKKKKKSVNVLRGSDSAAAAF